MAEPKNHFQNMKLPFDEIETVLVDIDGTLTLCADGHEALERPLEQHLSRLCEREVSLPAETDPCSREVLKQLGVSIDDLFESLREDLSRHTVVPEDAVFFLQEMKRRRLPVFTASTNSRFFCNLKLSLGVQADADSADGITGYFPGDCFGNPLGKFAPDYFEKILQKGNFSPERTLMIGNEVEHDLIPAKRAGIKHIVIVNRNGKETTCHEDGAMHVHSLRELFQ